MKRCFIFSIFFFILFQLPGQSSKTNFYYYKGEKTQLKLDNSMFVFRLKYQRDISDYQEQLASLLKVPINNIVSIGTRSMGLIKIPKKRISTNTDSLIKEIQNQYYVEFVHQCFKTNSNYNIYIGYGSEFVVKLKKSTSLPTFNNLLNVNDCRIKKKYPFSTDIFILSVGEKNKFDAISISNLFYETGLFEYSEPDFNMVHKYFSALKNSFFNPHLTHLIGDDTIQNKSIMVYNLGLQYAWKIATGSGINVAVIDDGIDLTHPNLKKNLIQGYDCISGTSNIGDGQPLSTNNAHGTCCAGILGAYSKNNSGLVGVAPNCKIIPINAVSKEGYWTTYSNIATGFDYAWQNGADIISNSWGGGIPSSVLDDAIYRAITLGRNNKGCLIFFGSGNNFVFGSDNSIAYPSSNENVISVGGINMANQHKTFTSSDSEIYWSARDGIGLDIVAPCVTITTTDISGRWGYNISESPAGDYFNDFNGTSEACPIAAGIAALILSVNPKFDGIKAREILESTCIKIPGYKYNYIHNQPNGTWNSETGYGSVNPYNAVQTARYITLYHYSKYKKKLLMK